QELAAPPAANELSGHLEGDETAVAGAAEKVRPVRRDGLHHRQMVLRHRLDRCGNGAAIQAMGMNRVEGTVRAELARQLANVEPATVEIAVQEEERAATTLGVEGPYGRAERVRLRPHDGARGVLDGAFLDDGGQGH